jgi:DNA-directed DNA polymerase III PolC
MLVPLHVKSHYSLGHGTAPIARLIERGAMLGLPAMALTDIENLYGQVVFHRLAREKGLKPLTGVELGSADTSTRLVLIARDRTGYANLSRIITRRRLGAPLSEIRSSGLRFSPEILWKTPRPGEPEEEQADPPINNPAAREDPVESIRGHLEGLFVLTDDPAAARRVLALPGADPAGIRLLLIRPGRASDENRILAAAEELGLRIAADPDIVYLDPEDRPFHRLQVAIGRNSLVSRVDEEGLAAGEGRHFPGPRECEKLFSGAPAAVAETHRIAEECDLDLTTSKPIFPAIRLPPGETAYSHLARIAFRGLGERGSRITPRHMERLARELGVISDLGFPEYFIVVGDIVRFARKRGIEVVGRGSGAGSLVAYALGITNVDPIEYGLYFERFLHEGRSDLPDIDVDLCWIRRDEVIDHVYRTYGHDRVAMISSHATFQPHLAFREAVKAFGAPIDHVNRWSRRIPYIHPEITSRTPLRDLLLSSPLSREISVDEEPFASALPLAERLLGQPHHLSVHPGGMVIADRSIDSYAPLERAAKGIVVTQYDMHSVEDVGLVKMDLLGNRCLTELQETIDLARAAVLPTDSARARVPTLAEIPDEDPAAVEVLRSARTLGCFQLESPAMRSLLSKLPVKNVRDCIAAVAIIRPGAAAAGAKETYIRRANGDEPPEYLHHSLRKLLEETHGVVIYEEDVMCIASAIAGISLAEGDKLRSAIKKCRGPEDLGDLENDFLRRSVRNGIEPHVAQAVWQDLRKFASYCFSKAHASGYGLLAYQSAYMKAHFPAEFACALLNNHAGMYSTRTIVEEVKRMGVRVLHPSASRSEPRFTVVPASAAGPAAGTGARGAVLTGLARVKGLAVRSIEAILAAREAGGPFRSLADFLHRSPIPHREVETLILSGALDDLPPPRGRESPLNHPQLLWELASTPPPSEKAHPATPELVLIEGRSDHPPLAPYDPLERIRNEIDVLEMAVTDHPLRLLRDEARRRGCVSTAEAAAMAGRRIRVAGLVAASRNIRTRKGDTMQFITVEDEQGLLESTLFPAAARSFSRIIRSLGPYVFEGKVEADRRAINLNVARVSRWEE